MRRIAVMVLVTGLLLALPSLVLAQEAAKYNFASAQGSKEIRVAPDGEGRGVLYFYNIDGNRITHITLDISEAPGNWEAEIEPPQHEIEVEIGGSTITVTENLHVEPSDLLSEELEDVPEGMLCISIPGRGYALAKAAYIVIRAPQSEEIGARADILVSAEAEWLGQSGAAAIKQARDFELSVEVVSGANDSTETIKDDGSNPGFSILRWLPVIIAGVVVILGAVLIPRLVARRKGG